MSPLNEDPLNTIYYETTSIEANSTTVARCKQFSLGLLYLIWVIEATQVEANKEKKDNTLDVYALFAEEFFDNLNPEVKTKTIEGLRDLADSLEYRETN